MTVSDSWIEMNDSVQVGAPVTKREREAPRPKLWMVEAAVRKNRVREGLAGYLRAFPGEEAPRNCKPSRDVEL